MDGELVDGTVRLKGKEWTAGEIKDGVLQVGKTLSLKRTERKSPTLGLKPPKGAVVLFDGTNLDHFPGAKMSPFKTLEAGCNLKGKYRIARFHLEFRLSWKPTARGQARSNSGIYLGGLPEIQILDSFGLEGKKNECGAFYGRREPDVNMCFPPLVWQTIDVEMRQPKEGGNILATVFHNGVAVHKDFNTGKKMPFESGLHLQKHGNRVQYRNIWLVEAK
ncbi:MAG: hypothetical protein KatS3mg105_4378 [Gemmatales bacterium]|nr:MAG: hypothetical protein KatS3mg105_4378 [Gemmatales bacterium]